MLTLEQSEAKQKERKVKNAKKMDWETLSPPPSLLLPMLVHVGCLFVSHVFDQLNDRQSFSRKAPVVATPYDVTGSDANVVSSTVMSMVVLTITQKFTTVVDVGGPNSSSLTLRDGAAESVRYQGSLQIVTN